MIYKKFINKNWMLCIFLTVVFILPVLYITRFTFPAADDFCRTALSSDQYFYQLEYWYSNLTGRYTNFFFSYLPVYGLNIYRTVLSFLFCSLGVALFYFIKVLWSYFKLKCDNSTIAFVSVLLYVTLISQLPTLYEFFYWYAASTVYLLSIVFFLLFLIMVIRVSKGKPFHYLLFYSLILLMNGNNEMLILISNFILIVILVKNYFYKKVNHFYLVGGNIVGFLSALIVILSPGNSNRQSFYPEAGQIFFSLKSAIFSAGMFSIKSILELPYLFFYIGLLILIFQFCRQKQIKISEAFNPLVLGIISFTALVSVFVVPYYATGGLNVNSGRIGNMIHAVFLIILCVNIFNFSIYLREQNVLISALLLKKSAVVLLSSYLLLTFLMNENYLGLKKDFREEKLWKYDSAMMVRLEKETNCDFPGVVEEIPKTQTLPYWRISSDETHWTNICFKEYLANVLGVDKKIIN